MEVFAAASVGATVVIANQRVCEDAGRLLDLIAAHEVTVAQLVPSLLGVLVAEAEGQGRAFGPALGRLAAGGEAATTNLARRVCALQADGPAEFEFHNVYGPSEACVDVTAHVAQRADLARRLSPYLPIGRAVAGAECFVLDTDLHPRPRGVLGQLYVGGRCLARGYLDAPSTTAQHFVPHPFSAVPGARLYATGDTVYMDEAGELVFVGRIDAMVKLRGRRIDLREIEAVLMRAPGVNDAAVVCVANEGGRLELVAFASGSALKIDRLADALALRLPRSHCPARIEPIDELPRTRRGKLDRRRLNALAVRGLGAGDDSTKLPSEPADELEAQLSSLWAEILRVDTLGVDDDFFSLGGDSIVSMQLKGEGSEDRAMAPLALDEHERAALGSHAAHRNHFAATLVVVPGDRIRLAFAYDRSRISPDSAQGLFDAIDAAITQVCRRPADTQLGVFSLADSLPCASKPALATTTWLESWLNRAHEGGDDCALISTSCNELCRWSWRQVDQLSERMARALLDRGIGPEQPVACALPRSGDYMLVMLAIMRAGACVVPLDPSAPDGRLLDCLEDCRAQWIVHDGRSPGLLRWADERGVEGRGGIRVAQLLDTEGTSASRAAQVQRQLPTLHPEQLALMIYTSGSSGRPKGVGVTQGNLYAYAHAAKSRLGLKAGAGFAWMSGVAVDLGHTSTMAGWFAGTRVIALEDDLVADVDRLALRLDELEVDYLKIAPTHLMGLLAATTRPHALIPRDTLVLGGAALTRACVARIWALRPQCRVFNHYGPTETTVGVCAADLGRGSDEVDVSLLSASSLSWSIGTAMTDMTATVCDHTGAALMTHLTGELHIGGPSVTRGCSGRPAATAERFVPDPHAARPGARAYRTGDAVLESAGQLHFRGRLDAQLALHGHRIEPGEIESWSVIPGCKPPPSPSSSAPAVPASP